MQDSTDSLFGRELARHEWAKLRQGSSASCSDVAAELTTLVEAVNPARAMEAASLLEGICFPQGQVAESAVAVISCGLAALADDKMSQPAQTGVLSTLEMIVLGEPGSNEDGPERSTVVEEAIGAAAPGLWLLYGLYARLSAIKRQAPAVVIAMADRPPHYLALLDEDPLEELAGPQRAGRRRDTPVSAAGDLFPRELTCHDWSALSQAAELVEDVPAVLTELVEAHSDEWAEAAHEALEASCFPGGRVSPAAVAVVDCVFAALAPGRVTGVVRTLLLRGLATVVGGIGQGEAVRAACRPGLWLLRGLHAASAGEDRDYLAAVLRVVEDPVHATSSE